MLLSQTYIVIFSHPSSLVLLDFFFPPSMNEQLLKCRFSGWSYMEVFNVLH